MKKYMFAIAAIIFCMFFSACGKKNPETENNGDNWVKPDTKELSESVFYYGSDIIDLYCCGDNGTIYTYSRDGKKLCEYDAEGTYVKEYPLSGEGIFSLCFYNQKIYYIDQENLCEMDLTSGESRVLYTFDGDIFSFGRMVAASDTLFILRKQQYREEMDNVGGYGEDGYTYEGEELICYQLSGGTVIKPDIPNIKKIAKKGEKELLVYAYDTGKGYYFTTCDTDGKAAKKQYAGEGWKQVLDIAYDGSFDRFVCADIEGIFLADLEKLSDKTYIFQGMLRGYDSLFSEGGFTYGVFDEGGKVRLIRLDNSLFLDEFPELKAYTSNNSYNPPYYGYKINYEQKSIDELVMIFLAGDTDYDFVVLDSWHPLAENIRRLGAYSALDSVDGLSGLLGNCFDYIKEAATAQNGDLWMLPLNVECPVLFYNKNQMEKYGLQIEQLDNYKEFIDQVAKLPKDGTVLYDVPYYLMTTDIINKYMLDYAIVDNRSDFDTDLFRTYLDIMSRYDARVNEGEAVFGVQDVDYYENPEEPFLKTLFTMNRSSVVKEDDYFHYDEYEYFHAAPAPGLVKGEKQKGKANASFIVVNPNSKKQKWVFSYLEETVKGISENKDSLMLRTNDFSDRPLWQEVHAILSDAEVYFEYPQDILLDELYRYRMEGQSFEDTVKEMKRKMDMYLNE